MKRIFCLLLSVIISAGVTGCAETPANAGAAPQSPVSETTAAETDDSEGVVPVESVEIVVGDDEGAASVVETAGAEENVFERAEGTFEYKGITFTGSSSQQGFDSFHIDEAFLSTAVGLCLYEESYNAAMAFIAADTDELMKYFDNFEYAQRQLQYIDGWLKSKLDNFISLTISPWSTYFFKAEDGEEFLLVNYIAAFDNVDHLDIDSIWVSMAMYLNDDGEWKLESVDYTG